VNPRRRCDPRPPPRARARRGAGHAPRRKRRAPRGRKVGVAAGVAGEGGAVAGTGGVRKPPRRSRRPRATSGSVAPRERRRKRGRAQSPPARPGSPRFPRVGRPRETVGPGDAPPRTARTSPGNPSGDGEEGGTGSDGGVAEARRGPARTGEIAEIATVREGAGKGDPAEGDAKEIEPLPGGVPAEVPGREPPGGTGATPAATAAGRDEGPAPLRGRACSPRVTFRNLPRPCSGPRAPSAP